MLKSLRIHRRRAWLGRGVATGAAFAIIVSIGACVPRSKSFTAFPAPSVTATHDLNTTQNPTPVTPAHIYGPTNEIGLGQGYRTINSQPGF